MCMHMYICVWAYIYIYMCVCVCVCVYVWVYIYVCRYMYVCLYIYIYIYACIYIYIYIYIYISISILGPVKPELGVIPSGQDIIHEWILSSLLFFLKEVYISICIYNMYIYIYIYIYKILDEACLHFTSSWSYLPTSPLGQDMTQGQFLSGV